MLTDEIILQEILLFISGFKRVLTHFFFGDDVTIRMYPFPLSQYL